jgi:hypothetical protein
MMDCGGKIMLGIFENAVPKKKGMKELSPNE